MPQAKRLRLNMRLCGHRIDEAEIIEWIEGLPKTESGKSKVKDFVVPILAKEIRRVRKGNVTDGGSVRKAAEKAVKSAIVEKQPKTKEQADAFPDIGKLQF